MYDLEIGLYLLLMGFSCTNCSVWFYLQHASICILLESPKSQFLCLPRYEFPKCNSVIELQEYSLKADKVPANLKDYDHFNGVQGVDAKRNQN